MIILRDKIKKSLEKIFKDSSLSVAVYNGDGNLFASSNTMFPDIIDNLMDCY